MKRVCYVLAYRSPDYIRTKSILAALRRMEGIELETVINRSQSMLRYGDTLRQLKGLERRQKQDVYILGFRGHEIYWPVRWLVGKRPIVFDAMMSPYAALVEENKAGALGRILSVPWRKIEAGVLQDAQAVMTDTSLHAGYLRETFGLPPNKIHPMPVGAAQPTAQAISESVDGELSALFYGSFLPLHGVDIIVEAASLVRDLPIRFDFVGGSPRQARKLSALCKARAITRYTHRAWIPFDRLLAKSIPRAFVCLGGPFGGTPQARRVVTGKTSQCLALGKPTIIGRIEEDYGFIHRGNCLLVEQGSAPELADSLRWCFHNQGRLTDIGKAGQSLYESNLSVAVIRKRLRHIIDSL